MDNSQEEYDPGVVSYAPPDTEALSKLDPANKQEDAPAPPQFNSVDDFLGAEQAGKADAAKTPKQYGTVDEFLNEGKDAQTVSRYTGKPLPSWARTLQDYAASVDSIKKAFTGTFYDIETRDTGLSLETENLLQKFGLANDYEKGENNFRKSLSEQVINGITQLGTMAIRLPGAVAEAAAAGGEASNTDFGYKFARDIRIAPDLMMEHFQARLPESVAEARAHAVIGEGESGYLGTKQPSPAEMQAREVAAAQVPAPQDIHAAARQAAPEVFSEYDALQEQRDILGAQMRELSANRPAEIEANAPHTQEIAELENRLATETLTDRKTERLQARIEELTAKNDEHIAQETTKVDPNIENIRQAYNAVDYRMRDLSPAVSEAYRSVEAGFPKEEATRADISPEKQTSETPPAAETTKAIPKTEDQAQQIAAIAKDVAKQVEASGRPAEEADAVAQLVAEHYHARAQRFGGKRGTAREMYERDGALIKASRGKVKAGELAQKYDDTPAGKQSVIPGAEKISDRELVERKMEGKMKSKAAQKAADEGIFGDSHKQGELFQSTRGKIRLASDDAKATISIMRDSNASTLIHETGHHWLDELMRDAKDEEAPADLVHDAATVRRWLGAEDELTTRQHEKFARGFERYLMEGIAPSRQLAGVFAKFRAWLTDIYQTVAKLRAPINEDIRSVFDRLLSAKPERTVIAPERTATEPQMRLPEVEAVVPEEATEHADKARADRRDIAKLNTPEDYHDITRGTAPEAEGRAAGSPESDGTGNASGGAAEKAAPLPPHAPSGDSGSKTPAKSNSTPGVYQPIPRKPLSLIDWVRKNGGLKDTGGDLKAALGSGIKGLLRPKAGMSIDDMALKAWEEGYFPEKGTTRPDVNEFLDKLIQDRTSRDHYSAKDQTAVDAYNDALAQNAEAEKIASELGISSEGKTHEEFWNEVRERVSIEEQARVFAEQEAANQAIFDEAVRKEKEFLESRGEAWEPASESTRSLEEMENEYQKEKAASEPKPGAGSTEEPGPAARDQGHVQEVGERSGGGAGDGSEPSNGEAGTRSAGDTPGSASSSESVIDEHGNPKYDLIEKRIEKINTPDDVDEFIRNAARENDAFSEARRGVVSHAQTYAMAEAMGVDGNFYKVMQTRRVGEAYNAHQLKAAEALFRTLSIDAHNKSKLPRTPENMAAFEAANQKFLMATGHFLGAASEAGRALNILRTMSLGVKEARDIQEFFQRNTGKTANDIAKQMDFMSKLDDGYNQANFIQASKRANFRSMMLEYYINCLISGPFTHTRYMIGNAIKAIETPLIEIPFAAAHGAIREALGKEPAGDRVYLGEAGAQLYALGKGSADGLRAAATAWKTGQSPFLPGEIVRQYRPNAIPGKFGDVINIPSTGIEAIHGFSKTVRYTQNIAGLSYRAAKREGLKGEDFSRRVAELTKNPTEEMMNAATKDALKELYMAPANYDGFTGKLIQATNSNFFAKVVVPFMKIGSQITREAFVERSPLGLLSKDIRDNLSGKNGGTARDMQMGKMTTGIALMSTVSALVLQGNATGDGPADPKERAEWLMTHRPNSITVGDVTIPYQGLGSLGMLMRFSANMTELAQHWDSVEHGPKLAVAFLEGISKSVLDENWMRGVKDMLDAVFHPEEYGQRYVQSMVSNWLPFSVGLGQTARAVDPNQREVRSHGMENGFGLLDSIRAKIPYVSQGLNPRRDAFGEPIPNGGRKNYINDPVVARMDALHIYPSRLAHKIRGVELTDQQYDDYQRLAGRAAKMRLDQIVAMPQFSRMPPSAQVETINTTIKLYRSQARNAILMQNPDIVKKAMDAKRKDMHGE